MASAAMNCEVSVIGNIGKREEPRLGCGAEILFGDESAIMANTRSLATSINVVQEIEFSGIEFLVYS